MLAKDAGVWAYTGIRIIWGNDPKGFLMSNSFITVPLRMYHQWSVAGIFLALSRPLKRSKCIEFIGCAVETHSVTCLLIYLPGTTKATPSLWSSTRCLCIERAYSVGIIGAPVFLFPIA
jgi:hypothetical protein